MVKYSCPKCNKEFDRKSNYLDHINKKFPCIPFIEEITPVILKEPVKNLLENENNLCCNYCGLEFNRKDNLKRHIEKVCKVKKLQDEEKENIFKILLAKDEELKTQNKVIEQNNLNQQTLSFCQSRRSQY